MPVTNIETNNAGLPGEEYTMTNKSRYTTAENRPFIEHPCGCVFYPSFTEGHWVDNFGDGPRQWQDGTHYEAWTDTSECREGHDFE